MVSKSLFQFVIILLSIRIINNKVLYEKPEKQDYCRALSLSGGGAKGSYEVGVLHQMARQLNGADAQYDVISGISVGSINAGALGLFPIGQEKEATQFL